MKEQAYAKINLALHVRAREANGYHRIETLFAFAENGDEIGVGEAEELALTVGGPFAGSLGTDADNLVIRAAVALRQRFGIDKGAAITLDKRLPVASGIGGGSADAAAALRLLVRFWKIEATQDDLLEIAGALGADVPACLRSDTVRGEGRGDVLISQDGSGINGMPLLLVNPLIPLSTASVFDAWDGIDRGPLPIAAPLATAIEARNDLEPSACALAPDIGPVLAALRAAPGAILARMSGSGATCFGLFPAEADRDAAADMIAARHPQWWQMRSRMR